MRAVIGAPAMLGMIVRDGAPATTQEVVDSMRGKLFAAVDGPMFSVASGEPSDYARFRRGVLEYRHFYPPRSIDAAGRHPERGLSIFVANGVAGAEAGAGTKRSGETFRAQTYPSLVTNGVATDGLRDVDTNNRPALGVLSDGRVFIALGQRINMPDLAAALRAWRLPDGTRATHAGYLDGGGSAALYVDQELDGNPEVNFNLRGRRVISWITLEQKPGSVGALIERVRSLIPTGDFLAPSDSPWVVAVVAVAAVLVVIVAANHIPKAT